MLEVPDADTLSKFPVFLQQGLIGVAFAASAIAIWRAIASRSSKDADEPSSQNIKEVLERIERGQTAFRVEVGAAMSTMSGYLQGIYRVAGEQRTDEARFANENNAKLDTLTEVQRDIKQVLHDIEHNTERSRGRT